MGKESQFRPGHSITIGSWNVTASESTVGGHNPWWIMFCVVFFSMSRNVVFTLSLCNSQIPLWTLCSGGCVGGFSVEVRYVSTICLITCCSEHSLPPKHRYGMLWASIG